MIGVTSAVVDLVAAAHHVHHVEWYTHGYFTRQDAPAKARLVVHEMSGRTVEPRDLGRITPTCHPVALLNVDYAICLADGARSTVHLFVPMEDHDVSRHLIVRVARALVLGLLIGNGCTFFHAACFAVAGTGVAVLGDRGAGKTTLLLQALEAWNADLVGNDKIAVLPGGAETCPQALGFPIRLGIRAGGILALGEGSLRNFLAVLWARQVGELAGFRSDLRTRLSVRPQELVDRTGSAIRPECRIAVAVSPVLCPDVLTPRLERLAQQERRDLWSRSTLHGAAEIVPGMEGLAPRGPAASELPDVATFRLLLPPGGSPVSREMLEELVQAGRG